MAFTGYSGFKQFLLQVAGKSCINLGTIYYTNDARIVCIYNRPQGSQAWGLAAYIRFTVILYKLPSRLVTRIERHTYNRTALL